MVFQYVILFNSDRELATTIHEASHYFDFLVTICIILYHFYTYFNTKLKNICKQTKPICS